MYRIVVLPSAKMDIESAINWYKERSPETAERFKRQTINEIEKLQTTLVAYGAVYRGLSRVFIKNFPYVIYFNKDDDRQQIVVYAILHNKQDRSMLNERL